MIFYQPHRLLSYEKGYVQNNGYYIGHTAINYFKVCIISCCKVTGPRKHALRLLLSTSCIHSLDSHHQCSVAPYAIIISSLLIQLGFLCLPSTPLLNCRPFHLRQTKIFTRITSKIPLHIPVHQFTHSLSFHDSPFPKD